MHGKANQVYQLVSPETGLDWCETTTNVAHFRPIGTASFDLDAIRKSIPNVTRV